MTPSNTPSRTPAWKRLGLKLKSAQKIPASHEETEPSTKKRKAEIDSTPDAKKPKKSKGLLVTPATPTNPTLSSKKSVTFTPETKAEDGDSIKQLFNTWVADQKAQDLGFVSDAARRAFDTPEPAKVKEDFDTSLSEKERRVKRVEKPQPAAKESKEKTKKKTKSSKVVKPTTTTSRPFLAYLRQYHEDRANWKFNKNHQNHILKSLFDIDAVPLEYAPSVYEYIKGLQGGVRTRLRDAALAIKVKDLEEGAAGFAESMSGSSAQEREKRQQQYQEFCEEYVATMTGADKAKDVGYEEGALLGLSDVAMKARVAKRARAEMVLVEMGAGATPAEAEERATPRDSGLTFREGGNGDGDGQNPAPTNDGPAAKVARKRKQRTANVEEDSSSSSDSSDSEDSDSSSGESEDDGQDNRSEETSSSSSSSSAGSGSGDSDDESDSGSGSGTSGSGSEEDSGDEEGDIH